MQWKLDPRPSPVVYREVDLSSTGRWIFARGKIYREADSDRPVLG
jgi:hypothetical protein